MQSIWDNPCRFLKSRSDIKNAKKWLEDNNLVLNCCDAKDWDTSLILPKLGDGNLLDMGCYGSVMFENFRRLGYKGELYGIDLVPFQAPEDVKKLQGDLCNTGLPSNHFDYLTCLSVIEHGVNVNLFLKESSRLLKIGGKLFLTFDYSDEVVHSGDPSWHIFSKNDIVNLLKVAENYDLEIDHEMDWETEDLVIRPGYHSPNGTCYTFGSIQFTKK